MLQNATPRRKSAPSPPVPMKMSLVLRLPRKMHLCRSSSKMSHACHRFWTCHKTLTFFAHFEKVHNPLRLPHKTTPERPKVARTCGVLYILTSKFAWCHNGVHFFDISTYKVVRAWCVLHILTSKCASRHNGVHFSRHRNFQKWSEPGAFCTF